MTTTTVTLVVILVIAICEAVKYAGLQSRFVPLLAVVLGLIGAWVFGGFSWLETAAGIILGLASTGGYRLVKTTILNK